LDVRGARGVNSLTRGKAENRLERGRGVSDFSS
jgi:hypothetical protein